MRSMLGRWHSAQAMQRQDGTASMAGACLWFGAQFMGGDIMIVVKRVVRIQTNETSPSLPGSRGDAVQCSTAGAAAAAAGAAGPPTDYPHTCPPTQHPTSTHRLLLNGGCIPEGEDGAAAALHPQVLIRHCRPEVRLGARWQLLGQVLHQGMHGDAGGPHAGAKGDLRLLWGERQGGSGRVGKRS
jgi:hypothetical protein